MEIISLSAATYKIFFDVWVTFILPWMLDQEAASPGQWWLFTTPSGNYFAFLLLFRAACEMEALPLVRFRGKSSTKTISIFPKLNRTLRILFPEVYQT